MRKEMSFKKMKLLKGLMILAGAAVMGAMVMGLWNWIMPSLITGAMTIDYWRALGLLVLCRILFGGFRGHGHGPSWQEKREHWQRWQAMTAEEREQFHKQRANWCRPQKTEEKQDD
ncbi:hypothetical protein ACEN8M_11990 [Duganella sp. CT11-72]|jgi:hypothetical protein|uniref:hypothetical protein n=2 Tax=unclassified Duganella TaxID=2636909 RepID=UPI0039B092C2